MTDVMIFTTSASIVVESDIIPDNLFTKNDVIVSLRQSVSIWKIQQYLERKLFLPK